MLKGKHILVTLFIIGLLWLNWFIYSTIIMMTTNEISGDSARAAAVVFAMIIEAVVLFGIFITNIHKIWNWEFNLNKWLCKLKY